MALAWQPSLLAEGRTSVDGSFSSIRRVGLDGESWVDHAPGWVEGADALFAHLVATLAWEGHDRWMYDRRVAEPRLRARVIDRPDVVEEMRQQLSARYEIEFTGVGANLYRDGRDSVAWHGDRVARDLPTALVATVSLGGTRRFLLRPKGGGPSVRFEPRSGDVLVMGGACQRRWDHTVPKQAAADPRISITFRHAY